MCNFGQCFCFVNNSALHCTLFQCERRHDMILFCTLLGLMVGLISYLFKVKFELFLGQLSRFVRLWLRRDGGVQLRFCLLSLPLFRLLAGTLPFRTPTRPLFRGRHYYVVLEWANIPGHSLTLVLTACNHKIIGRQFGIKTLSFLYGINSVTTNFDFDPLQLTADFVSIWIMAYNRPQTRWILI